MSTVTTTVSDDASVEEILQADIRLARNELRPISRRQLALQLVHRKAIPFKEAMDLVDAYCDEKESAVPTYVSSEFGLFWLKVVAVAWVAIGIGVVYYGVRLQQTGKLAWPWYVGATLTCGFAALCWVKSIEGERHVKVN